MALHMKWSDRSKQLLPTGEQAWGTVLEFLRHRYVREKQHAMRYRQHAERIDPQFRDTLIRMAAEEEQHAASIGARIRDLGEKLPDVIPIHVAREDNSWSYLRTDLDEEQRCRGELSDLPAVSGDFPEIVDLLQRMDTDSQSHRAKLREMLERSVPQSVGPP
ncbi:MAG TPA: ferritin-like domain-containing protein [Candidatus Binatia bacterium]